MDNAQRCSEHVWVLNPKHLNANNATLPPRQLSFANIQDVAAAPAASAASAAYGTSISSLASPPLATASALVTRTATIKLKPS